MDYEAYVKRTKSDKLKTKSDKYIFVGYSKEAFIYQFYNSIKKKVFFLDYTIFLEKQYILGNESGIKIKFEEVQESIGIVDQVDEPKCDPTLTNG